MMRPVMFDEPDSEMIPVNTISSTYLWGADLLVAPVTEPGATRKDVYFPRPGSAWFDFYTDERHRGGVQETVKPVADHIPTYVRAGAFVPMAAVVQTTRDYSTRALDLHYWYDASVATTQGELYDDDGRTPDAYAAGKYELLRFTGRAAPGSLRIGVAPQLGAAYAPSARRFTLKVHNVATRPRAVEVAGAQAGVPVGCGQAGAGGGVAGGVDRGGGGGDQSLTHWPCPTTAAVEPSSPRRRGSKYRAVHATWVPLRGYDGTLLCSAPCCRIYLFYWKLIFH